MQVLLPDWHYIMRIPLKGAAYAIVLALVLSAVSLAGTQKGARTLSGNIITDKDESVAGVSITVRYSSGEQRGISDAEGKFRFLVPEELLTIRIEGERLESFEKTFGPADPTDNLEFKVKFVVPRIHESIVIEATVLDPSIDRRDDAIYRDTLFARDDQVLLTLNAGINAGQHEGGGKSLEIRRFGFNLDHGGVSGGLKILVDDVQQNQGTQGHGQGYLGQLKSLTPELIQDVSILNGPFSAAYGDFSGLGVVHIRLRESLPNRITARIQAGSFNTYRTFLAYSPDFKKADSFIAYEASRTNGPFENPLRYKRDNITGNYTWHMSEDQAIGFKLNAGRNDFFSSGQIPLDEVAAGRLDRFGFLDPDNGGKVRSGTAGLYYRREGRAGDIFKVDGFLSRSLFDLYSNFTFFLNDEINGDEIQQHDSRLQEGINVQYLRPYKISGQQALLNIGGNFQDNQINVGLYNTVDRDPISVSTSAHAHVTNLAGYAQQGIELMHGHMRLEGGLRYDFFRFDVDDKVTPSFSGVQRATRLQPKASLSYTPSDRLLLTMHLNYGRGISSQDARGIVRNPSETKVSTTDFYQAGLSYNRKRVSIRSDLFLIDRSNEQVYIPDDGSIELKGPSRAYGGEGEVSAQLMPHLTFNAGFTKVGNAFYRGTTPRIYVDSAAHFVSNAGLTLADWQGFSASLRFRHISSYRLDGEDANIRASGLTILDFSLNKRVRRWVDFNMSVDNLTNKRYFETQNFFESRLRPGDPVIARIHATPGYPIVLTIGVTLHFFERQAK